MPHYTLLHTFFPTNIAKSLLGAGGGGENLIHTTPKWLFTILFSITPLNFRIKPILKWHMVIVSCFFCLFVIIILNILS